MPVMPAADLARAPYVYIRPWTGLPELHAQLAEVRAAGIRVDAAHTTSEFISVNTPASRRPHFSSLTASLRAGDRLMVRTLDALGCSLDDIRSTLNWLGEAQVEVCCLAFGADPMTAQMFRLVAALADLKHDVRSEATIAGLDRARALGRRIGRPPSLDERATIEALQLLADGRTVSDVARRMSISRATVIRLRDSST